MYSLLYTKNVRLLPSKFLDVDGLLFKVSYTNVNATSLTIAVSQNATIANNPNHCYYCWCM